MRRITVCLFLLALTGCEPKSDIINGYVEGEYLYLAPTTEGVLRTLAVHRGDEVAAGQALFALDTTNLQARLAAAQADVARTTAQWNNLLKGQRPEEIEVIFQQKKQAEATLTDAQKDYNRLKALVDTGAVSRMEYDQTKAALHSAKARVQELDAQIKAANLGGREDEIAAARAAVDTAEQSIIQIKQQIEEAAPIAPAAGRIEDTYYLPGEFVGSGSPVVSLLPPENVKVRFFVPQALLPTYKQGDVLNISCDGCSAPIPVKITYIASQAEYTPPVIYSIESRDKLVFMLEAVPDVFHPELRPGLPVDISRAAK